MVTTFGNSIITAFTNGIPVNEIYTYGTLVWPGPYYIKWNPSSAGGQFNIDGTTHYLSTFGGRYYWSTGIINADDIEFVTEEDLNKVEEPIVDPDTMKNIKPDDISGDMVFSSNSNVVE